MAQLYLFRWPDGNLTLAFESETGESVSAVIDRIGDPSCCQVFPITETVTLDLRLADTGELLFAGMSEELEAIRDLAHPFIARSRDRFYEQDITDIDVEPGHLRAVIKERERTVPENWELYF